MGRSTEFSAPRVVVIGASFIDASFHLQSLPPPDQTVTARQTWLGAGGKGLNQAVAAARLEAKKVTFISAIGDDSLGSRYVRKDFFQSEKTLKRRVHPVWSRVRKASLPVVAITTADDDVRMVATPNDAVPALRTTDLSKRGVTEALLQADAILMTMDYGSAIVRKVLDVVRPTNAPSKAREGQVVILNAAPAPFPGEIASSVLERLDWLVPNLWEARRLLNLPRGQNPLKEMAEKLRDLGPKAVCVTAGNRGCVYVTERQLKPKQAPLYSVVPIDTTGASDAFCAALAVLLGEGCDERRAITAAAAAGALAAETFGSSCSMPSRSDLASFLRTRGANRKLVKHLM